MSLFKKPTVLLILVTFLVGFFVFVVDFTQNKTQKSVGETSLDTPYVNVPGDSVLLSQDKNSYDSPPFVGLVGKIDIVNMKQAFDPTDKIWLKWNNSTISLKSFYEAEGVYLILVPVVCEANNCATRKNPDPESYYYPFADDAISLSPIVPSLTSEDYTRAYGNSDYNKITTEGLRALSSQGVYVDLEEPFSEVPKDYNFLYFPPGLYKVVVSNGQSFIESDIIRISSPTNPTPKRYSLKIGDSINGSIVENLNINLLDSRQAIYFSGTTTLKGVMKAEEFPEGMRSKNGPKYITTFYPTVKNIPLFSDRPIYLWNIRPDDPKIGTEQSLKIGGYFYSNRFGGEGFLNDYAEVKYAEIVP